MSDSNKLVLYTSEPELKKHAAGYPCLVNFNPFDNTGEIDDGCGHYAHVVFAVVDPMSTTPYFPPGEYDTVVFVRYPQFMQQHATPCNTLDQDAEDFSTEK